MATALHLADIHLYSTGSAAGAPFPGRDSPSDEQRSDLIDDVPDGTRRNTVIVDENGECDNRAVLPDRIAGERADMRQAAGFGVDFAVEAERPEAQTERTVDGVTML